MKDIYLIEPGLFQIIASVSDASPSVAGPGGPYVAADGLHENPWRAAQVNSGDAVPLRVTDSIGGPTASSPPAAWHIDGQSGTGDTFTYATNSADPTALQLGSITLQGETLHFTIDVHSPDDVALDAAWFTRQNDLSPSPRRQRVNLHR